MGSRSGANGGATSYKPDITSYDYSSPISEAGDHNIGADGGDLFVAVQKAIAGSAGTTLHAVEPPLVPKVSYGAVFLSESAFLFHGQ